MTMQHPLTNQTSPQASEKPALERSPLARLPADDLSLVVEFVLCSGSLKDLAKRYGVSYPTIRGRLDGLIERLRAAVEDRPRDPLAETLAEMVQRGELTATGARKVLEAARERVENGQEHNSKGVS